MKPFAVVKPLAKTERLFLCLLLALVVRPVDGRAQSERDLDTIVQSGVLRVALTAFDLPGFHRRVGDGFRGPEIELAGALAKALGVRPQFDSDAPSFDAVVDRVAQGLDDIGISKLSQSYARLKGVRFSHPYLSLHHALLFDRAAVGRLAKGEPTDEALREFNGRLGVVRHSAYVEFAERNFPRATLNQEAEHDGDMQALADGKVDAIYRDEFEVKRLLRLKPALNVRFGAAVVTDETDLISIAICRSCSRLQGFIDYHLARTADAFTLKRLLASDLRD